jgi:hypothetical protein
LAASNLLSYNLWEKKISPTGMERIRLAKAMMVNDHDRGHDPQPRPEGGQRHYLKVICARGISVVVARLGL